MSVPEISETAQEQTGGASPAWDAPPSRTLDVLFVLSTLGSLRYYQSAIEALANRGHNVRLLLEGGLRGGVHRQWLEGMLERPNFVCEAGDLKPTSWHRRGAALRRGMAYAQFLDPAYDGRPNRLQAFDRPPGSVIRWLTELPGLRSPTGLRVLDRSLAAIERALPSEEAVENCLERVKPDVIALGTYSSRGSLHSAFVRAALKQGVPTVSCVRSWDNLTTRARMTAVPHRVFVWNEVQLREAVELHGIAPERVVLTGAPNFDDWFDWQPRLRDEFLGGLGLDPSKPVILWVGGAMYGYERRSEAELVAEWLDALRSSDDPLLREAGVLLRPHPRQAKLWRSVDFSVFDRVVVWQDNKKPIVAAQKADYFDSIFHSSAVVGVNTSAMIEAAIVGRPVLTILHPDFHIAQLGTLHFEYLLESHGGAVRAARSLHEHVDELSEILAGRDSGVTARSTEFVARFVRPHGLHVPAAAVFCTELERLAAAAPLEPEQDPLWARGLRGLIVVGVAATDDRRRRRLEKRVRRLSRRARRFARAGRRSIGARSGGRSRRA